MYAFRFIMQDECNEANTQYIYDVTQKRDLMSQRESRRVSIYLAASVLVYFWILGIWWQIIIFCFKAVLCVQKK